MKTIFTISLFIIAISILSLTGCGKKKAMLEGNVYFHDADSLAYIAGFDNDTLYYIIRGPKLNQSHKSRYTIAKTNDSLYTITLDTKPPFWQKNTWDIIMAKDKGFYSAESRNYYQYSPDKNILR